MTDQELSNILFVDIETATGSRSYHDMDHRLKYHWDRKAGFLNNPDELSTDELYTERAGIFAEFGRIVTIAVGYMAMTDEGEWGLRVKAFASTEEVSILREFKELLVSKFHRESLQLCAHNGREFDFPYICRRMLINGIPIPEILDIGNMKPWEIPIIDTMNMWKFGDRKNFTSLDLFGCPVRYRNQQK